MRLKINTLKVSLRCPIGPLDKIQNLIDMVCTYLGVSTPIVEKLKPIDFNSIHLLCSQQTFKIFCVKEDSQGSPLDSQMVLKVYTNDMLKVITAEPLRKYTMNCRMNLYLDLPKSMHHMNLRECKNIAEKFYPNRLLSYKEEVYTRDGSSCKLKIYMGPERFTFEIGTGEFYRYIFRADFKDKWTVAGLINRMLNTDYERLVEGMELKEVTRGN